MFFQMCSGRMYTARWYMIGEGRLTNSFSVVSSSATALVIVEV
jgi:hypothetical protein